MKKIIYNTLLTIALLFSMQLTVNAATLGLTTQNPTLGSSSVVVDYLEFGSDGDLFSLFTAEIDSSNGVTPDGSTTLDFDAAFPLATPTINATGFLDILDANGQFLGGDLLAVGFTEDVVELQFNNLLGSAAGDFGSSVLALVTFDDPLNALVGPNPFNSFVDGDFYTASVSISNVVNASAGANAVPEPNILALLFISLIGMFYYRRKTNHGR
jgi:PEP-CTERM motif-containing protein